ncbi:MAG: hypothetical protein ACJ741_10925 [Pyrinomonadaceae bacterium]
MADQEREEGRAGNQGESRGETGDPGRTPGTAEGDEQTVDEDLERQA